MFARASSILALALCASATVIPHTEGGQCNTGSMQCCNSVQSASSPSVSPLVGLLGIVLGPISGLVGLTCLPIVDNTCTQQPVCCTNNNFNGFVALGCTPININL